MTFSDQLTILAVITLFFGAWLTLSIFVSQVQQANHSRISRILRGVYRTIRYFAMRAKGQSQQVAYNYAIQK
jgi:hypothetical protein